MDRRTAGRRARGHAHREGGLGHLAAVVRDAPAEAARDAAAVVLLLAAHHRLHGVAAHPDGSLRPEGTGDGRSSPPCGAPTPNPLPPQPQVSPKHIREQPAWSSPREPAHTNDNPTGNGSRHCTARPEDEPPLGEPHSHKIRFSPHCPPATACEGRGLQLQDQERQT